MALLAAVATEVRVIAFVAEMSLELTETADPHRVQNLHQITELHRVFALRVASCAIDDVRTGVVGCILLVLLRLPLLPAVVRVVVGVVVASVAVAVGLLPRHMLRMIWVLLGGALPVRVGLPTRTRLVKHARATGTFVHPVADVDVLALVVVIALLLTVAILARLLLVVAVPLLLEVLVVANVSILRALSCKVPDITTLVTRPTLLLLLLRARCLRALSRSVVSGHRAEVILLLLFVFVLLFSFLMTEGKGF